MSVWFPCGKAECTVHVLFSLLYIMTKEELQNYGHYIIKQRPLRRRQNKKTSDHHSRMFVSLAYTHAQDSLGNVVTRTTMVILQQPHTHIRAHTHARTHAHTRTHMHARMHVHMHTMFTWWWRRCWRRRRRCVG